MVTRKASVETVDKDRHTALHLAAVRRSAEVLALLIDLVLLVPLALFNFLITRVVLQLLISILLVRRLLLLLILLCGRRLLFPPQVSSTAGALPLILLVALLVAICWRCMCHLRMIEEGFDLAGVRFVQFGGSICRISSNACKSINTYTSWKLFKVTFQHDF